MLAGHVHDSVWAGSSTFTLVIPRLKAAFEVGREEVVCSHGGGQSKRSCASATEGLHLCSALDSVKERDSPPTADQLRSEINQILWVGTPVGDSDV